MNKYKINNINRFIIFIHIEKSAGTTFNHFLRNNIFSYVTLNNPLFWSEKYRGVFTAKMLKKLLKYFPNINGIGGHTLQPYLDYQNCINDKKVSFITFLRDPISRYLSHFNFQNTRMMKNWKLDEFLKHEEFSNFQTKKIAGSDDIEKAKLILTNNFDFVGITEYFYESIHLLSKTHPLINNKYYINKNITDKSNINYQYLSKVSKDILEKIKKQNASDIILYKYAVKSILFPNLIKYSINTNSNLSKNTKKHNNKLLFHLKIPLVKARKMTFEKIIFRILYK